MKKYLLILVALFISLIGQAANQAALYVFYLCTWKQV